MKNEILIVFDFESTGVDVLGEDSAVQFSAVAFEPAAGKIYTLMSTLCNPGVPSKQGAIETHGITDDMVQFSPTPRMVMMQFRLLLSKISQTFDVVLGGHNSEKFDLPLACRILPQAAFTDFPHVDSYLLARRHFPDKEQKLTKLYCDLFQVGEDAVEGAHDATFDCYLTIAVLPHILEAAGCESYVGLAEHLAVAQPYQIMPFGKYKGRSVDEVPVNYFSFCYRKFEDIDRDMELTFRQQLGLSPAEARP